MCCNSTFILYHRLIHFFCLELFLFVGGFPFNELLWSGSAVLFLAPSIRHFPHIAAFIPRLFLESVTYKGSFLFLFLSLSLSLDSLGTILTKDSSSFSALSYFSLKVLVFDSRIKSVLFCQHRDKPCQEAEKSVLHIINLRPPIHKQSSRNFLQSSTGLKKMENKILMDSEAMRIIQLPAFTPFSLKSCYVPPRGARV